MDYNNGRAAQGQVQMPGSQVVGGGGGDSSVESMAAAGAAEGGDWRSLLLPDTRQRIIKKIMETLKRHLPFSGQEGMPDLKKIAVRFEEKIYAAGTTQQDYLRKISLKMLTMETKSQNPMANSLQPGAASNSKNPQDPGARVKATIQLGSETYLAVANEGLISEQLIFVKEQSMSILKGFTTKHNIPNDVPDVDDEPGEDDEDEDEISPNPPVKKSKKRQ